MYIYIYSDCYLYIYIYVYIWTNLIMTSPEEPPDREPDLGGPAAFRGSPVLEEVNGWIDLQVKNILFVGFRWYNLPAG